MFTFFVVIHLLVSFCLIGVVLMQSGKGSGLAGAFGTGGNATVFGGRGAVDFLGKATWILGGAFMVTSMTLAILSGANRSTTGTSLIKRQATAPAVPGPNGGTGPSSGTAPSSETPAPTGAPSGEAPAGETPSSSTPSSTPAGGAPSGGGQ
ncbi:MAG: preprotein translocase subunit SecG [Candidatus Eisenbacteria bacterium]